MSRGIIAPEFEYQDGTLAVERVSLLELAEEYGTPLYVYSRGHLVRRYTELADAFREADPLICFSVKVNTNRALISTLAEQGAAADVVSGGELTRALQAGIPARRIVFAGVGKTAAEIDLALKEGILFFTVESEGELELVSRRARALGLRARIAPRVNPDVDPQTHRFISTGKLENKFGMDVERVRRLGAQMEQYPAVDLVGLHMHIGSQITTPDPYVLALQRMLPLAAELRGRLSSLEYLDVGGGMGIRYSPTDDELSAARLARAILPLVRESGLRLVIEPGRYIAGNCGLLLTRVLYVKENGARTFVIVDAGMTDLIRPPLYGAYHHILPVREVGEIIIGDVVGPVCETADFFAAQRSLPAVRPGDLLAVMSAGAYGFVMSSNYNSRCRPAEVMVQGSSHRLVRRRESIADLTRLEL